MKALTTLPFRYRRSPSIHNLIQIENGTFYRQRPIFAVSSGRPDSNPSMFQDLHFSLPAYPLIRDNSSNEGQQHWAVVGADGATTFLDILQGKHICVPSNARTFPQLSLDNEISGQGRRRSPRMAIQYVGFLPGKAQGSCSGVKGSYLSERYESHREETDWSLLQYLAGEMELNPLGSKERDTAVATSLSQVITDLKLDNLIDMPVSSLSSGQTRRASIAKALLRKPELLLLDKPFIGLDPRTLLSLSPLLRELAYKSSPRLIMSLRPQDPIPDWITHLAILGHKSTLALAGPKQAVLFASYRWSNGHTGKASDRVAEMAALMTEKYGPPPTNVGHTLSANGVSEFETYSTIMSSKEPKYVQDNGLMSPEYLDAAEASLWQIAAGNIRQKVDLQDLLALTCLLPKGFHQGDEHLDTPHGTCSTKSEVKDTSSYALESRSSDYPNREPLIELRDVVVSYRSEIVLGRGKQAGFTNPGINLTIRHGTRLALLGPNGSGKSTLLSLLTSDHPKSYSLPIKYFGRSRLPSKGYPGLSLWEIQSHIGHSSPEVHVFFPRGFTIRKTLESAWGRTFADRPKLSDEDKNLVDEYLRWWEPELNATYQPTPRTANHGSPLDDWISTSWPPFHRPIETADELAWATSQSWTFGNLAFQSQRLLLFLRAIIKNPDIVILDEAFAGLGSGVRDKAITFLSHGQKAVQNQAHSNNQNHMQDGASDLSTRAVVLNHRAGLEKICRDMGLEADGLFAEQALLSLTEKQALAYLRSRSLCELQALVRDTTGLSQHNTFGGLTAQQALVVVSHVREEIPDTIDEYMRLPGRDEVIEQGMVAETARIERGTIRTMDGWSRIWGLRM